MPSKLSGVRASPKRPTFMVRRLEAPIILHVHVCACMVGKPASWLPGTSALSVSCRNRVTLRF